MNSLFIKLTEIAKPFYATGDSGHDFAHIQRVMKLCQKLGEEEKANLDILLAAALLHDVVNVPKNHPRRKEGSRMAAEKGALLMKEVGYEQEDIDRVFDVILEHSFSLGKKPSSIESEVLQDCDRLDALGAIGIMRMVACGVSFKASFYDHDDPFAKHREYDDKSYTLDHFYTKLFKLPELMNTKAGFKEGTRRADYMKSFVKTLENEICFD